MPRPRPPQIGLVLTTLRVARGWNQQDLAAATGVGHPQLSQYETGRCSLTRERFDQLVAPLGYDDDAIELVMNEVALLYSLAPEDRLAAPALPDQTPAEAQQVAAFIARMTRASADLLLAHAPRLLAAARLVKDRADAAGHWEWLAQRKPAERRLLLEDAFHLQTWAMSALLSEESEKVAVRSAAEALDLASLGLRAAELAIGEPGWLAGLKAYAWAFLGNARRVGGDFPAADAAFATARQLWQARSDACTRALPEWRLHDLEASLRRDQRQWDEALALLDRARTLAPPEMAGRILIKKATVLEQAGDYAGALATLEDAGRLLDKDGEPRMGWLVQCNQIVCLCHLGRFQEAEDRLRPASAMAIQLDNALDLLRVLWLQARVTAGCGRRQEAIDTLERVRTEFAAGKASVDTALVSLELAILYLEEGRTAQVRGLAQAVVGIFRSQRIHREAAAALRLFYEAAQAETATVEQVRHLISYLERTQLDGRFATDSFLSASPRTVEERQAR